MAHSLEDQTLCWIARDDQASARRSREGALLRIQPYTSHAVLVVGTVALEAVLRQDAADISIEVDLRT
jgi:hypothetical protein